MTDVFLDYKINMALLSGRIYGIRDGLSHNELISVVITSEADNNARLLENKVRYVIRKVVGPLILECQYSR